MKRSPLRTAIGGMWQYTIIGDDERVEFMNLRTGKKYEKEISNDADWKRMCRSDFFDKYSQLEEAVV